MGEAASYTILLGPRVAPFPAVMKAAFLLLVEEEEKKEGLDNLTGLLSPSPLASPDCLLLTWISKRTL